MAAAWMPAMVSAQEPENLPMFTKQPAANISVKPGFAARMTVQVTGGTQPYKYQWYFNGTGNFTALTGSRQIAGVTSASLSIGGTNTTNVGGYYVTVTDAALSSISSNVTTLSFTGNIPVIKTFTARPANLTLAVGKSATFTITANGTPTPTYRWLLNGANITGATRPSYTISKVTTEMNGANITVVASNPLGNTTPQPPLPASYTLTVTGGVGPSITTEPGDQTVASGGTAKFSVGAAGSPTLLYQWFFGATPLMNGKIDGVTVSGATTARLTVSKVGADNVGNYSVMVFNGAGMITSNLANLTLK